MKEVTEWDNNPREMLVWDDDVMHLTHRFVIYIMPEKKLESRVIALSISNPKGSTSLWKHCAEMPPQCKRRMTNKELTRWLREKPNRE